MVPERHDEAHPRPYVALGRRMRQLRTEARLSGPELAKLAGLSRSFPSLMEKGKARPGTEVIRDLAGILSAHGAQADLDELLWLAGYAPRPAVGYIPVDDPDKEGVLRRLARWPRWALDKYEAMATVLGVEAYDPETGETLPEHRAEHGAAGEPRPSPENGPGFEASRL